MLAAVIEGPGVVVIRDTAPPQLAACARPEQLKIVLDVAGP